MLLSPAAALLRPKTPVIILADGILSQLNFETLLVPGVASGTQPNAASNVKMHYLLDDLIVSSAPSLAMLGAAEPAGRANREDTLDWQSGLSGSGFPVSSILRVGDVPHRRVISVHRRLRHLQVNRPRPLPTLPATHVVTLTFILYPTPSPTSPARWIRRSFFPIPQGRKILISSMRGRSSSVRSMQSW